mmetsp:Transcript_8683/g.32041  ORF Transcript_8683/g.32041 Transcript_8683/m.32041 type:complete len:747 (-) Transcript_8683:94-2334(-)|eukprot:CAMPEP_0117435248 /NCGR_PEP_ID=MMETSP0759-20121206/380_1 /TAXON_ID=63605 /ORGANISM="Percolomonas cosmopolitus, Strain WS" /LENGTH=746 /DNA_ID=CAMNT_0005226783 /DNA_START=83 /DNA_END=2323 /DNA_ORIENTATION=+
MVRGLQAYLSHALLVQKESVSMLAEHKIAIDVHTWLRQIPQTADASLITLGSALPSTFRATVDNELVKFEQLRITPVFVFAGVSPLIEQHPVARADIREKRESAWVQYEKIIAKWKREPKSPSMETFENITSPAPSSPLINSLIQHFRQKNIEYIRAPCLPWSQMFNLYMKGYVQFVFGANDLLIYPFENVITKLDLERGYLQIVNRKQLLERLGSGWDTEQFLECCLLSGTQLLPTFSQVDNLARDFSSLHGDSRFLHAHNLLSNNGYTPATHIIHYYGVSNGSGGVSDTTQYHERFFHVKEVLQFHIFIDDDCRVKYVNISPNSHITSPEVEARMHYLIAPKMPDEVFYLLSQAIITPSVMNHFIHFTIFESQPLADSKEFRDISVKINSLRQWAVNLFATSIDALDWTLGRPVHYVPSSRTAKPPAPFAIAEATLPHGQRYWNLPEALHMLQSKQNSPKSNVLCPSFRSLLNPDIPQSKDFNPPTNASELCMYLRLRLLAYLNYFSTDSQSQKKKCTQVSQALSSFNLFDASSLIFVESVRATYLNSKPFTPVTMQTTAPPVPHEPMPFEAEILLFTRTMSLLPLSFNKSPKFKGRVYKDLTQFTSIATAHVKVLHNLIESIVTALFVKHQVYQQIRTNNIAKARFDTLKYEPNNGVGCVWRFLLTEADESKNLMDQVKRVFPSINNVEAILESSLSFWEQCVRCAEILCKESLKQQSLLADFRSANRLLQSKLSKWNLPLRQ